MSFNAASFEYISGMAGNAIWRYNTTDNLCSGAIGVANSPNSGGGGYFDYATKTSTQNEGNPRQAPFPNLQKGDLIIASINAASVLMINVTVANANGVSWIVSN